MELAAGAVLALVLMTLPIRSAAADGGCLIVEAPAKFKYMAGKPDSRGRPTNGGILPSGFVSVAGPVVHGIDVSKWQETADFVRVWHCGGRFAYVRLSAGEDPDNELEYRQHWANARNVDLMVGGYHNFVMADSASPTATLDPEALKKLSAHDAASAEMQADLFLWRLKEVLRLDPTATPDNVPGKLGLPYLPIMVDAIERPQTNGTAADRLAIGTIYANSLCRWLDRVKADPMLGKQVIILFTSAAVYKDYGLARAQCGLADMPVWLTSRPEDGGPPDLSGTNQTSQDTRQLCLDNARKNRCILQQYTSFGGFALFKKTNGLDLDRFFGSEDDLRHFLQSAGK